VQYILNFIHSSKKNIIKYLLRCIGYSFRFILIVGLEKSIVNTPLVSLYSKNTNDAKSEVRLKQLIHGAITIESSTPTLRINLNEHPINFVMNLFLLSTYFFFNSTMNTINSLE
jgi:hypothetical protein